MIDTARATATILIVEDSSEVRDLLQRILSASSYHILIADDGISAVETALAEQPDLIVLDVGLPGQSGFQVAEELRRRAFHAPVLMLTARGDITDRVTGLDAGADDYLAKPFDNEELLARVKALLRRSSMNASDVVLRVGDLVLDPVERSARRGNRDIVLTRKEYALLEFLMRNAGRPITRQAITEQVWKQTLEADTNIVDVYVNYLRRKLRVDDEPEMLHTVRGVGYMLKSGAPD